MNCRARVNRHDLYRLLIVLASLQRVFFGPAGWNSLHAQQQQETLQIVHIYAVDLWRASQSLESVLNGAEAGRISSENLSVYFEERLQLMRRACDKLQNNPTIRELDRVKKKRVEARDEDLETSDPAAPDSVLRIRLKALLDAALDIRQEVEELAAENGSQVSVHALARPSIFSKCRRFQEISRTVERAFQNLIASKASVSQKPDP